MGASWIWLLDSAEPPYTGPRPEPRWSTAVRRVESSPKPDPRASTAQRKGDVPT